MKKSVVYLKKISLALSVGLVIVMEFPAVAKVEPTSLPQNSPTSWQTIVAQRRARLRFKVRGVGFSTRRTGATSRGGCSADRNAQPIRLLLPEFVRENQVDVESTIDARPTFFVHIPQTSAPQAEFQLLDDRGKQIYQKTFDLQSTPTVVVISIPNSSDAPSLELGKTYKWKVALNCDPDDPTVDESGKPQVIGSIKRVEPSVALANELKRNTRRDRPSIFAAAGRWNDTLTSLAQLRIANPNDATLREDWKSLLDSVGLGKIAEAPLLPVI
ncbi:MAG TPA: hypothetical protein DDZ80_18185 [Cyanobacteria bacterium UBA8803]|nr:hypothetical protein [Cyanobacteria bacterium UBA9273]HBL60313.1 hypothetical protein [Cyanobacteria bacterium UBA8803]